MTKWLVTSAQLLPQESLSEKDVPVKSPQEGLRLKYTLGITKWHAHRLAKAASQKGNN